jgi:O-acetyl-ADP-ribose deacetylase (regulator of RNase III)
MIELKTGDIFSEETEAIVNTVNCVGVMGRGVALQFKKIFPQNFEEYFKACEKGKVQPGEMFVHETGILVNPKYIINFPTKRHWRGKSKIEDIDTGLDDLVKVLLELNIKSITLPPLGSGLGGLDWDKVKKLVLEKLGSLNDIDIIIYEPHDKPFFEKNVKNKEIPKMTPGRAALIELMYRYLGGLLDPFVTLLEIHKLMYFLQESGENLRLKYNPGSYGPYAENLRHVLNAIEGHFISGYEDGGDKPEKQLKLVPGAYEDASDFLSKHHDTKQHFARVSDLVEGFESPFGLELLSTVHWIISNESPKSFDDLLANIYNWSERKKKFTTRQIGLALKVLKSKNWLNKTGEDHNVIQIFQAAN